MIKRFILFLSVPIFSLYADHFKAVQPILALYDRPMTILSIGESDLLYQMTEAYPVTCILTGTKEIENYSNHQIIHLQKTLTLEDLQDLNKREHFDLILVIHSLHHLENWKASLHELFKLGDNLIVEIYPETAPEAYGNSTIFGIARYLTNLGLAISLNAKDANPFLWYCFKPKSTHPALYSDPATKGISLLTYHKHDGIYPSREWISNEKKKLPIWKRLMRQTIRTDGKMLY